MSFPTYTPDAEPLCWSCSEALPGPDRDDDWPVGRYSRACSCGAGRTWFDRKTEERSAP